MASPLAIRDFRWLWSGSLCAWASQWIQQAALGWVVYEITGSGALLGAVLGVRAIPMLLLGPLSGVAADRYDRRRLLQASQLFAAAVAAAFGAALALGMVAVGTLFAFSILTGAAQVMDRPARFTSGFELVPRAVAMKAVALNTTGFSMMRVLGPAIAGYLIGWFGAAGSFFVQGTLHAASAALALAVVFPPRRAPQTPGSAWSDTAEGLRFAAGDPVTRLLVVLGALPFFLLVPIWTTLFPIFAKDVFRAGPEGLGWLLTAVGAGGTLGALAAHALARVERQGVMQAAAVLLMASAIAGIAFSPTLAWAAALAMVGGAGEMLHVTSNMAMLQLTAPEALRGRIASLALAYPALISLGGFLAGPLADLAGVRHACLILAGVAGAGAAALLAASPRLRGLRLVRS